MTSSSLPEGIRLESLEVGAAPLVRLFLTRLDLPGLFDRHLPPLPGRPPALPSSCVPCLLLPNLLLARQPLYAIADWASRRVPGPIGLLPGQAGLLNDDRVGRALDHLHKADRASLLTALVRTCPRILPGPYLHLPVPSRVSGCGHSRRSHAMMASTSERHASVFRQTSDRKSDPGRQIRAAALTLEVPPRRN